MSKVAIWHVMGYFPGVHSFGILYPVIIDINFRQEKLQQLVQYMKEGAFFDPFATDNVQVSILIHA
eukprot:1160041-Pelagomonas_calceolata.AAC.5